MKQLFQPLNDGRVCNRLATVIFWIWILFQIATLAAAGVLGMDEKAASDASRTVFFVGAGLLLPLVYLFASRAYFLTSVELEAWQYAHEVVEKLKEEASAEALVHIIWVVEKDVANHLRHVLGRDPSEEEVNDCMSYLNNDDLKNASIRGGWEAIYDAVDRYLGKKGDGDDPE